MRGRPAERSGRGCPERVWTAVCAPWVPDTGTGRACRFSPTTPVSGQDAAPDGALVHQPLERRPAGSGPVIRTAPACPVDLLPVAGALRARLKRPCFVDGAASLHRVPGARKSSPRPHPPRDQRCAGPMPSPQLAQSPPPAPAISPSDLTTLLSAAYRIFNSHGRLPAGSTFRPSC